MAVLLGVYQTYIFDGPGGVDQTHISKLSTKRTEARTSAMCDLLEENINSNHNIQKGVEVHFTLQATIENQPTLCKWTGWAPTRGPI